MSAPYLLWVVLAIILFWCVGVYNRVMRLRARGFDAFRAVEKHLHSFSEIVSIRFPVSDIDRSFREGLEVNLADGGWVQLVAQLQTLDRTLKLARTAPLKRAELADLSEAFTGLTEAWLCLKSAPADLAGPAMPEEFELQWDENAQRVRSATVEFNQTIGRYNEAISQFPARLVCGLFGFKPIPLL
jgi:LemA protein